MNRRTNSTPPTRRTRWWSKAVLLGATLALGGAVNAQVSAYTFAQSTVTFVQSTGANITGIPNGWDDDVSTAQVSFGFNFVFNGVTYTSCWVSSNGYITFGTTQPVTTDYRPLSSINAYSGVVSAFARDLIGTSGAANRVKFEVQNASPNRVAVFEWRNALRYNSGAVTGDVLNFQIRLNETTNTIDLRYGACAITNTTGLFCQVGLRGASNTDFNNRKTATNWSATTAGTVNNDSCTTRNTVIPTTNLNLRWTPPPACPLTITPSPAGPYCGAANAVLTASGSSGGYSWAPATGLSSTTVANPTCTATISTTYTVTGVGCTGSATTTVVVKANPTAVSVTPPTPSAICAGNSVGLTASGGIVASGNATATSGTISVAIPDVSSTGISNSLNVSGIPGGVTIDSVIVTFSATHGFDQDIVVNLEAPNGQVLNLVKGTIITGGTNFTNTRISSVNTRPAIPTTGAPFTNTYKADAATTGFQLAPVPLPTTAVFSNLFTVPNGTWKIRVYDDESIGTGTLTNWQIKVAYTGFPASYTWAPATGLNTTSGASVTAGPAVPGQTYTVTSTTNGCTASQTVTVPVNARPTATLAGNGPFCASGSPQLTGTLTGTGPWSITYTTNGGSPTTVSGIATSPYTINPTGPITSTTAYAITAVSDANCAATGFPASVNVVVNPLPVVTCGTYGPVCVDAADIPLGGSPSGGTWSGTGVTGNSFDPSAGTQTVTYTYTDGNNCTNFCTTTITVNPLPVVTCGTYGPACVDAPDITLGGSPSGGTWSGTGVTGNSFDPSVGTQTVQYDYTDGNGCSASCSTTITVNPLPVVTCGTYGPVCVDAADITLGGSPTGGTWSGTGVTAGVFDPSAGTQTVQYDYTDGNGCSASCTTTITVNPLPVVTCGTYGPVCVDAADITLGGSPAGGTWSGTGVTGNSFDPSAGTQTVQYDYTDGNGCSASCTTTITVNPLPVVTCPADITDICSVDAAFTLTGGSPAGGTYSGPGVSGGNFDPAVAGAGTHTITYSFTDGNGCSNSCTFTVDVTAATTWYGDLVDGDGLGDPAVTLDACTQPVGYVANSDDECPTESGTIGSACDDGNCFTTGDVLNASCVCAGTLVPCDNWTLTIDAGSAGNEISWTITESGGPCVLATGGNYGNNTTNNVNVCVPQGNCFNLTFTDAGGNGIQGGGWKLTDNNGRRILDNVGNGGCFTTTSTTAEAFCNEPSSTQTVIAIHCDKENWLPTDVIIAGADAAVSAQYGIGDQTDDGYQFWFQNPCGGYNRKIFRNHATSGGQGPANALRATKLALSSIVTNPLPTSTLLNVRVRARVNGVNAAWGPACRFRIDATACTITQLNNYNASPNYSCGVSGKIVGAGGNTGKIFANVVTSGGNPATHYRFQFSVAGEGYLRNVVSTNAACVLGVWATNPLLCGTYTYDVRVQASFDGGTSYCPLGPVCNVTITNNQPVYCTPTVGAMQEQADTRSDNFDGGDFAMYPNPNRGDQLFVNMSGFDATVNIVTVEMYDGFGKRVMNAALPVQDGFLNTTLELSPDMAAGLYMVNVTAGNITKTERLVIQR